MNKIIMCQYDEAFTIKEMREETNLCESCKLKNCPNKREQIDERH